MAPPAPRTPAHPPALAPALAPTLAMDAGPHSRTTPPRVDRRQGRLGAAQRPGVPARASASPARPPRPTRAGRPSARARQAPSAVAALRAGCSSGFRVRLSARSAERLPERRAPSLACPVAAPRRAAAAWRPTAETSRPEGAVPGRRRPRVDRSSPRRDGRGPRRGPPAIWPEASREATPRRERRSRPQRRRAPGPRARPGPQVPGSRGQLLADTPERRDAAPHAERLPRSATPATSTTVMAAAAPRTPRARRIASGEGSAPSPSR